MWLDALDLVLGRLKDAGLEFGRVAGVSGAGMQHGTVFWSYDAEQLLASLDASISLAGQLDGGSRGKQLPCILYPILNLSFSIERPISIVLVDYLAETIILYREG